MVDTITHTLYKKSYTIYASEDRGVTWEQADKRIMISKYDDSVFGTFETYDSPIVSYLDEDKNLHIAQAIIFSDTTTDTTYGNGTLAICYSFGQPEAETSQETILIKIQPTGTSPYYVIGTGFLITTKEGSNSYKGYAFYEIVKTVGSDISTGILLMIFDIVDGAIILNTVEEVVIRTFALNPNTGSINVYVDSAGVFHIGMLSQSVVSGSTYNRYLDYLTYDGEFVLVASQTLQGIFTNAEINYRSDACSIVVIDKYVAFCVPEATLYTPTIYEYDIVNASWETISCPERLATTGIYDHALFLNYDNNDNLWIGGDEPVLGNKTIFVQKRNRTSQTWEDAIYAPMGNDLRGYFTPTTQKYDEFFVSWKFDTSVLEMVGIRVTGVWADCDNEVADIMFLVLTSPIGSAGCKNMYEGQTVYNGQYIGG